jgi:two-component system OmpR family response regulator
MTSSQCHVLCVDDDDDNRAMLSALLGWQGFEVTAVASAEGAKRAVLGKHFNLAVLDNWMEDGEGPELCRWIREQSPATHVIFYSAAAFQRDRDAGMHAGAAAYISKPEIEGLLAAVNGLAGSGCADALAVQSLW